MLPLKSKKNVVLIGCTGVLGNNFVEKYHKQYHIIGIARNQPTAYDHRLITFKQADITKDIPEVVAFLRMR